MAWTTPRTWLVGEIVTASQMNTHVRDNLRFLKGLDGNIELDNAIVLTEGDHLYLAPTPAGFLRQYDSTAENVNLVELSSQYRMSFITDNTNSSVTSADFIWGHDDTSVDGGNWSELMRLKESGELGLNISSPDSMIHILQPGTSINDGIAIDDGTNDFRIYITNTGELSITKTGTSGSEVQVGNRKVEIVEVLYINDFSSSDVTKGLVINQEAEDDSIIALKSSDVAHGITGQAETDTYAEFSKVASATGGLEIKGLTEDTIAVEVQAMATNENTTKSASGIGHAVINAFTKLSTGVTGPGSNSNIFVVRSGSSTRFIVDDEGDTHRDGTANTFDAYDDAALARAFDLERAPDDVIRTQFDDFVQYNRDDLIEAGVLHPSGFYNESQLLRLHNGAIWQQETKLRRLAERLEAYEKALLDLGGDPKLIGKD